MKRKGLIISTALIALLAVGCNKGNGGKTKSPWGEFLASAMKEAFGEVLPFVQFNEENVRFQFLSNKGSGRFVILDDNEADIFDGYGDKLVKKGFEEVEDEEGIYYEKEKNGFYNEVSFAWYPATSEYVAGNQLDASYGYETEEAYTAAHSTSLSFDSVKSFFNERSVKNITLPKYNGESIVKGLAYNPNMDTLEYDVYDSSHDEMVAYAESLEAKGWTLTTDSYGDYSGYLGQTGAYIAVEDYIGYSYDCIRVYMYVAEPPLPEEEGFPIQHVLNYLYSAEQIPEEDIGEDDFAPYPEGENTEFEYDDEYASYYGGCDVYVTGTSHDDCAAYVQSMVEDYDWELGEVEYTYDSEDTSLVVATMYPLTFVTGGSHDVLVIVYDQLDTSYEYVDIFVASQVHKEEETGPFPLEALNAFIVEYDLGFELTAGLEGDNFTFSTFENGGYHCFQIILEGNNVATFKSYVNDILIAANYSLDTDEETRVTYNNDAWHQIDIAYVSDEGCTFMNFWE